MLTPRTNPRTVWRLLRCKHIDLLTVNSLIGDSITLEKVFYPCVVKASKGEDTKAVRLAKDQPSFLAALEHALSFSDQVIVERCVYFSLLEDDVSPARIFIVQFQLSLYNINFIEP